LVAGEVPAVAAMTPTLAATTAAITSRKDIERFTLVLLRR
jgi:hypothetical protein